MFWLVQATNRTLATTIPTVYGNFAFTVIIWQQIPPLVGEGILKNIFRNGSQRIFPKFRRERYATEHVEGGVVPVLEQRRCHTGIVLSLNSFVPLHDTLLELDNSKLCRDRG